MGPARVAKTETCHNSELRAASVAEMALSEARAMLEVGNLDGALGAALTGRLQAAPGSQCEESLDTLLMGPQLAELMAALPDAIADVIKPRRHVFLSGSAMSPAELPVLGRPPGTNPCSHETQNLPCADSWPAPKYIDTFCDGECPVVECNGGDRLPAQAVEYLVRRQPVVLRGLDLFPRASQRWSFKYLAEHLRGDHDVFVSRDGAFSYWYGKANSGGFDFVAPTHREALTFREFVARQRGASSVVGTVTGAHADVIKSNGGDAHARGSDRNASSLYLQQSLWNVRDNRTVAGALKREMMSEDMLHDWDSLTWPALLQCQAFAGLHELSVSTLFCSGCGAFSRLHFDQMSNLHLQVRGAKRWLLFAPEDTPSLYAYPRGHPLDRKSQVDLEAPQFSMFPAAAKLIARGKVAVLRAGDALWLPTHWWHAVQSLEHETVSVNFWWEFNRDTQVPRGVAAMELAREVEDIVVSTLGPGPHVEQFLRTWLEAAPMAGDGARLRKLLLARLLELRREGCISGLGEAQRMLSMLDADRYANIHFATAEDLAASEEAAAEEALVREMRRQGVLSYVLHEGGAVDLNDPEDVEALDEATLNLLVARAASSGFPEVEGQASSAVAVAVV